MHFGKVMTVNLFNVRYDFEVLKRGLWVSKIHNRTTGLTACMSG